MSTSIKDLDGGRIVDLEVRGDSVFLSGKGFCYEFDLGLFWHGVKKEMGATLGATDGLYPLVVVLTEDEPAGPAPVHS